MNRENKSPLGRLAAATVAVLALLTTSLGVIAVTATPASAETKYGYAKVMTKESYLRKFIDGGVEILHVDTQHATAEGFYFAVKSPLHQRGFGWVHQPYGMWCGEAIMKVGFNGWLNAHKCMVDATKPGAEAWASNTSACKTSTGLPWKDGSTFAGQSSWCGNTHLYADSGGTFQEPSTEDGCAPWEEEGLTPGGTPKCMLQRYAWETGPSNAMWLPAPDTCTGMPADTNRVYRNPDTYAPASGGDGSCTGAALAPNCPSGSTHEGCTGTPETAPHTVDATVTATASNVPGTASASRSASASVVQEKVTKKASQRFRGRRVTAKASKAIVTSATETRTASRTATSQATRTATMSCTAPTEAEATACATSKAQGEAHRLAYADAEVLARQAAEPLAANAAQSDAQAAAQAAAQAVPVTDADRKAAGQVAKRKAEKRLARKIRRMG